MESTNNGQTIRNVFLRRGKADRECLIHDYELLSNKTLYLTFQMKIIYCKILRIENCFSNDEFYYCNFCKSEERLFKNFLFRI